MADPIHPVAREGDDTDHGIPAFINSGSESTKVNGLPMARVTDSLNFHLFTTPPFIHISELIVQGSALTFDEGLPIARAQGTDDEGNEIPGDLCSFGARIIEGSDNTFDHG